MKSQIKKGINIWSFDQSKSVESCMQLAKDAGFEGIELALAADGPIGMKSSDAEIIAIKKASEKIGIEICSLATGLYWQYSLTSNREDIREKAKQVVKRQIDVAALLGVDCILVCPGTVGVDFKPEDVVPDAGNIEFFAGSEIIDYDVAYERAQKALMELAPYAGEKGVIIGIENIWNKFLLSPLEMKNFLDEINSPFVGAFLDVGNMLLFGYPEHWIKILNKRIKKVHFKDFRRDAKGLAGFVDLLAGDVDWVKVIDAFEAVGYHGWASAEMCPTYHLYTDQMIYNASASMDCILRRK
ncbi:sugar phosphate isomerase/epimerase [Flexilinea flocculi]|jgi:L-ribulose-5-phosphate 3-epimerase|uniref:Sugar phosphate isomerase/epimerase n=1 Tax=Flexilinea flocculi TaxID=1678840 RepID=A0A0K8PBP7_9CHLR|nr:sugar phosphate isomerase/epimerase family protein [Flexilinea flocculi]GAP39944.1 sugar phosphate isomerase/epimerase [Flexilinea flocculi]